MLLCSIVVAHWMLEVGCLGGVSSGNAGDSQLLQPGSMGGRVGAAQAKPPSTRMLSRQALEGGRLT